MSTEEEAVCKAAMRFYAAIEGMMTGKGLEAIRVAWHHTGEVTSGHPSGDWALGWDEVWATWEVFASFARPDGGGSVVKGLKAHVYGDFAYTTCVFVASPFFGGDALSCTNVLVRRDGEWKLVHHHADKSPGLAATLEKLALQGA